MSSHGQHLVKSANTVHKFTICKRQIFYNGYKAAFYSCSYPRKVLSSVNDAKKDLALLTKADLRIDQSWPSDWPKLSFGLTKAVLRIDQNQVKMTTERTPQSSEYLKKHTGVTELWPTHWQSKNTLLILMTTLWYIW